MTESRKRKTIERKHSKHDEHYRRDRREESRRHRKNRDEREETRGSRDTRKRSHKDGPDMPNDEGFRNMVDSEMMDRSGRNRDSRDEPRKGDKSRKSNRHRSRHDVIVGDRKSSNHKSRNGERRKTRESRIETEGSVESYQKSKTYDRHAVTSAGDSSRTGQRKTRRRESSMPSDVAKSKTREGK